MHFFSNVDVGNTQLRAEQVKTGCDPEEMKPSHRFSFDAINAQTRKQLPYDPEGMSYDESDDSFDQHEDIPLVESEDEMIQLGFDYDETNTNQMIVRVEKSWDEKSENENDVQKQVHHSHFKTTSPVWEKAEELLRHHQKHFLEPAPSYKDPQELALPRKNCEEPKKDESSESATNDLSKDDDSPAHEDLTKDDDSSATDHERGRDIGSGSIFFKENDPEPASTPTDSYNTPPRCILRQMSSNLLSSDSSVSSSNASHTKPKLQGLVDDSDDDEDESGQRRDRYSIGVGAILHVRDVEQHVSKPTISRPPQLTVMIQKQPPTGTKPQVGVLQYNCPQNETKKVVLSPKGSAIESTKYHKSWSPFNFWGS
jgi:hypothetical protein